MTHLRVWILARCYNKSRATGICVYREITKLRVGRRVRSERQFLRKRCNVTSCAMIGEPYPISRSLSNESLTQLTVMRGDTLTFQVIGRLPADWLPVLNHSHFRKFNAARTLRWDVYHVVYKLHFLLDAGILFSFLFVSCFYLTFRSVTFLRGRCNLL